MKLDRRALLRGAVAGGGLLSLQGLMPAWAQTGSPGLRSDLPTLSGPDIALTVGQTPFTLNGRTAMATTINGVLPAPVLRLREGQNVRLSVTNGLDEDTSIHWHGILLPFQMDGVPGISFPGIRPRETFVYEFPVRQSGTFWYHSHSGLQEAMGHYGPIVIDPAGVDPIGYDREHVLVLSRLELHSSPRNPGKAQEEPGLFQSATHHACWPVGRQRQDEPGRASDVGTDAHGPARHPRRQRLHLHLSGQRPWAAGELDRSVPAGGACPASHHQRFGDVDLQHPHSRPGDDRGSGRWRERPSRRDR